MSDLAKCGHCGFDIASNESSIRHFGFYTAHSASRCRDLLRDRIEALEAALNLAANRLARCALDHGIGTQEFLEVSEWGEEARAALVGGGV